MTTIPTKSNIDELKGKIKEEWGKLTDDDLKEFSGNVEQIAARISQKYEMSKHEALSKVNEIARKTKKAVM